jgi:Trk K+ transport system NAD-binding subunit
VSASRPARPGALNNLLASPLRNLGGGVVYMLVVMTAATAAYVGRGWSFGDAVYMVVLTVYTVGYDEVRPVDTPALREITIALIVFGCTGMIFLTGALIQFITLSQLQQVFRGKRVQNQIDRLSGHVIICGFGRIGVMLARDLRAGQAAFVVVDQDEGRLADARELGYLCVHGNATDEAALELAGIQRARCLATVLPDDAANVFITLSARSLNTAMVIIARGEMPSTESKLVQAGANRVVLPTHIGAERIAELILYPQAAELLHGSPHEEDFARELRRFGLEMEVVAVAAESGCIGRTVRAIEQEAGGAFLIVALNRRDGASEAPPPPAAVVQAGDGVVVVGHSGGTQAMAKLFRSKWQRSAR